MNIEELLKKGKILIEEVENKKYDRYGKFLKVKQFLNEYAKETSFTEQINGYDPMNEGFGDIEYIPPVILKSYLEYIEKGLLSKIDPKREAQLEVVNDFLNQAQILLKSKKVHPAAPAVIIGAALEEFLRNWIESNELEFSGSESINTYCQTLRSNELITKQDLKDITSWAGIRNSAAHGRWEEVSSKEKIEIMLLGVNLFIRKYTYEES